MHQSINSRHSEPMTSRPISPARIQRPAMRPENLISLARSRGLALAAWRLPGSDVIRVLLTDKPVKLSNIRLEDLASGFVFAPFEPDQEKLFLPADYMLEYDGHSLSESQESKSLPQEFISDLISTSAPVSEEHNKLGPIPTSASDSDGEKTKYTKLVRSHLHQIETGIIEKVVAARRKTIRLPEGADPIRFYMQLVTAYPHAMVSLVSMPETGLWIGASPEPLISLDENDIFRTVALAGTKRFQPEVPVEAVTWTQKEIEEQALVERYIISCFKKIRLREYDEYGPKTFRAGNLLHLKSVFEVNLREVVFPELGTVMLELLHPTSAVCGMPRKETLELIRNAEGFNREFYAGFLGPVHDLNETHLYVNLRCMKWGIQYADLFAGAGITSGSVPEQEWAECEMKMQTLHEHLRHSTSNPA